MYMRQAHAFACLVIIFLGVLFTMRLAFVWWDTTWKAAVNPVRMSIYSAVMEKQSPAFAHSGIGVRMGVG